MKDTPFLRHVRDYAHLSQRFRRSYKDVVDAILQNYINGLAGEGYDEETIAKKTEWAKSVVAREYDPAEIGRPAPGERRQ